MANFRLTTAVKNSRLAAIVTAAGANATIKVYSGTQPATADTALSGNTLLGTLTCGATFGTVSAGVLTLNAITEDSSADATGTATWARLATSGGTAVADFDVGTSGATLNLNNVSIVTGGPIQISSFTIAEA